MPRRRHMPALLAAGGLASRAAAETPAQTHDHGQERIAFLIYPGFTALDVFGPHNMLAGLMPRRLDLVAATAEPVLTDTGFRVLPTATFAEIEPGLDVLCVPGGTAGTLAAMADAPTIGFLRAQGAAARYVTAVCTGSLLLGAAGLLRGHRATSHWMTRELLPIFGAEPVDARVVESGNRITGGGVTAGIDFGLRLVGKFRSEAWAQAVQLVAEYAPEPPFDAGTPERAPPPVTAWMREMFAPFLVDARAAAEAAMQRLPNP